MFVGSKEVVKMIRENGSVYVFTDDLKFCEYCGRKFLTREELLFHLDGCKERMVKLYPNRKKIVDTQKELWEWLTES